MSLIKTPQPLQDLTNLAIPKPFEPSKGEAARGAKYAERIMVGNISVEQRFDSAHVAKVGRVLTALGTRHAMQPGAKRKAPQLVATRQQRPNTLPSLTAREHQAWLSQAESATPTLPSAVRETVAIFHPDRVDETLYLPDEPRLGITAEGQPHEDDNHPLSVLKLRSSTTQMVYMVTTPEHRIRSSAKRRRWAMARSAGTPATQRWPLLACMEFRRPDELIEAGLAAPSREQHLAQIQRELSALSSINPDIAVHGLLETPDGYFLALMTNLPEEASYLLESTPDRLFEGTLLSVLGEAVTRLHQDVHERGMVHGDVKLNNIMLTPDGHATLIDVASLATLDADGLADIHSTSYAPPEQTAPLSDGARLRFGKSGDVFAVGLALFDACTEREATLLNTAALSSPHAARLSAHADELRANKSWLMHEMTLAGGEFYAWRANILKGGYSSDAVLRDSSRYGRSCHYMAKRFPELFEHWLVSMTSDDVTTRSSLAPTLALINQLKTRAGYIALRPEIQANVASIIGQSMSAQLEPLLGELLMEENSSPPASP